MKSRDTRKSSRDGLALLLATAAAGIIGGALDLDAEQQAVLAGVIVAAGMWAFRKLRTWKGIAP